MIVLRHRRHIKYQIVVRKHNIAEIPGVLPTFRLLEGAEDAAVVAEADLLSRHKQLISTNLNRVLIRGGVGAVVIKNHNSNLLLFERSPIKPITPLLKITIGTGAPRPITLERQEHGVDEA